MDGLFGIPTGRQVVADNSVAIFKSVDSRTEGSGLALTSTSLYPIAGYTISLGIDSTNTFNGLNLTDGSRIRWGTSGAELICSGTAPLTLHDVGFTTASGNITSAGYVGAVSGFRVNNAATDKNFLVGDGTNFVSATLADSGIASATWTPTWGGFSAAPTGGVAKYIKIGRLVWCAVNGWAAGTSNATTKTITLPFTSAAADVMAGMGHIMNNGTFAVDPGRIDTRAASTTADLYRDLNATAWTNSGSCVMDFTLMYEADS